MLQQFRTILLPYIHPAALPAAGQQGSGMGAGLEAERGSLKPACLA
jgi:hypothetical protein